MSRISGAVRGAAFIVLLGVASYALANPAGPQVVHGQVSFVHPDAHTLSITNSPGAIINWQSFGINAGEITQFIQQNANSAVLNRVVGQDPSALLGELQSNGQVYLVNPNGIVVGQNAVIDTAGFIASTLAISDEDFKRGDLNFADEGNAGNIVNRGFIKVGENGNVLLVAPSITNEGVIQTDGGNLILAAGHAVTITSLDDPALQFDIQAPDNEVINLGELVVNHGAAEIFAGSIKHQGSIQANSLVVDEQGRVQLVASEEIEVTSDALIVANGERGGDILIESDGDTVIKGSLEAIGNDQGGDIHVLGDRVGLFAEARVDASGGQGGGDVLIGGDFQGANSEVRNARQTQVGDDAVVRANAEDTGDGGKVIVWADDYTGFAGRAEAKAGASKGDGGFVEISGKENLAFAGEVDASAANGEAGTVLFDPKNIDINDAGGAPILANDEFTEAPAASVQMDPTDIIGILESGNDVILQANNDITLTSDLISTGPAIGRTLTLQAGRTIDIDATLQFNDGSIDLRANDASAQILNRDPGAGSIFIRNSRSVLTGAGLGTIDLSLGTAGTVGSITLEEAASISTFETPVSLVTAVGGAIVLAPAGLGAAASISTLGEDLTLIADTIDLQGSSTQIFASSGLGFIATVKLAPASGSIAIVNTATGSSGATLELETSDLQHIDLNGLGDGFLVIGDTSNTTDITIVDSFTPAGGGNIKDSVSFEAGGDLIINANLDGTGLTGSNSIDADIGGDIVINATVNTGAASGAFLFGQNNTGATADFSSATIASPSFTLQGGGGVDALVGNATLSDVYIVNGVNAGTLSNPNLSTIDFSGVENLNAGGGDDLIAFQSGGSLSGFVDGGAGSDTADYSAIATPVNASLPAIGGTDGFDIAEASVSGNFTNMNVIIGGSASDTLSGVNGDNTWTYSAADTGIVQTSLGGSPMLAFSAFENVTGGNQNDTFDISNGSVSGTLDGGGGTSDVISYATRASSLSLDLETFIFPSVGTAANINGVIGGTLSDGLNGADDSNLWNITANNTGDVDGFTFSSIEVLIGGTADDTFVFADGVTVTQIQGASTPSLNVADFSAWTTDLTVLQTASNTFDVAGMTTNSNIGNVSTGAGNDSFIMSNNALASFTGTLNGGAGVDNLDYGTNARVEVSGITVDLENGLSTDVAGILNIEEFIGSTATTTNEIQGSNAGSTWVLTNDTDGTLGGALFSNFQIVQGGTGVDAFTLPVGFNGVIQDLGGSNGFIFNGALGASALIAAANGNDIFTFIGAGGAIDGFINGAGGTDTIQFNGGTYDLNTFPNSIENIEVSTGGVGNINANLSVANLTINDTGQLGGTGNIAVSTAFSISSSVVSNVINRSGNLILDPGSVGTINIGAGGNLSVIGGGTLQNDGDLTITGAVAGSQINLDNTVTFAQSGNLIVDVGQMNVSSVFSNNGTITLTNSGTFGGLGAAFSNLAAGTLAGNGTFVAPSGLTNNGLIAPGLSIGTLNITGDVTFSGTSTLEIEVTSGLSSDQLIVSGTANLNSGATLDVVEFGGYTGNGGDTFSSVLSAGSGIAGTSGVFDTLNQPAGFSVNPSYGANALDLSVLGAAFNTWIGGLVGDWDVIANWSFGALPTAGDDVLIDTTGAVVTIDALTNTINTLTIDAGILLDVMSGSLTIQSASTIDGDMTVTGGGLTLNGATVVNGTFGWTAGNVSAPGTLTLNGVTTIGGGDLSFNIGTIDHANASGSSSFAPSQFNLNASTFRNSGTLDVGDVFLDQDTIGAGAFENTGTLNKVGAGQFDVSNSGTLTFSSTGTINVLAGEVFVNRDNVISGFLNGPGKLVWNSGSSQGALTIGAGGTLEITGGLHSLVAPITYNGAGDVIWNAGSINLAGFDMTVNTPLTITGSDVSVDNGLFIHNNNSGASIIDVAQLNLNFATFRNTATAILEINTPLAADEVFYDQDSIGAGLFENFGTINKTGAGRFNVSNSGTLSFINTGTMNVAAGDIFINNTSSLNGNLTGAGKLIWNSGTSEGTLNIAAASTFEIIGSTHTLGAPMTFNGLGDVLWSSGPISLGGNDLTVNTPLMMSGPDLALNGSGTLTHTDASGSSTLSASQFNLNGVTFRNAAGAILQIDAPLVSDTVFYDQDTIGAGIFENLGTINKTGLGRFEVGSSGTLSFTSSDTLNIAAGEVFVNNTTTLGGNLAGAGTLIWNNGTSSGNLNIGSGTTLELSGGAHTFSAASTYSGSGIVRWLSGSIAGADLTVNTIFEVSGSADKAQNTLTITHTNTSGSSVFDSTGTWNLNGATFVNTGTLDIDSTGGTIFIDQDTIGPGLFDNQGTLNKLAAGRFEVFSAATLTFQNSGTIDIQGGEIFINNNSALNGNLTGSGGPLIWNFGNSSGNLNIGAGSVLEISGSTHTLTAPSNYSGAGTVRWIGGIIQGANLTVDTILEITGGTENSLNAITLTHTNTSGSSIFDSAGTFNINGATFLNTGTMDIDSTAATVFIDQDSIGPGIFQNTGTLNKIGTGRFEVFSGATLTFDNDGSLNINTGEVAVNQPFTNDGLIDLATGTTLSGGNPTFVNGATGTIQGTGTIVTPVAGLNNLGLITPGNGNTGVLNVTGNLNFNSGGTFDVQLAPAFASDRIIVSGNVNLNAGSILNVTTLGGYAGNFGDAFAAVIATGGALNGAFATINQPGFSVTPSYIIGPAGDMTLTVGGVFNTWTGALDSNWLNPGNWSLGVVPNGTMDVRINTTGQTITVGGTGTQIVNTLGVVAGSQIIFTTSDLQLNGNSTINGGLSIGSSLSGAGDVISNGAFNWTGGTLFGPGQIFVNNTALIDTSAGVNTLAKLFQIENGGTATWQGGQDIASSGGAFQVASGGVFDLQANAILAPDILVNPGGLLRRSAGTGSAQLSGTVTNNGLVDVQSGTLSAPTFNSNGNINVAGGATLAVTPGFNQNGGVTTLASGATLDVGANAITLLSNAILTGNGMVNGDVINTAGVVAPGSSPGVLTITGNYVQGPSGSLAIEVQDPGATAGVDYDQVVIGGTATLDGNLLVTLLGGYTPPQGQVYDVLTYSSATGNFANIPEVPLVEGTQLFSGTDTGLIYQLTAGAAQLPPMEELPAVPNENLGEEVAAENLNEIIALDENTEFLDNDLVDDDEEDDEQDEYKVCSGT